MTAPEITVARPEDRERVVGSLVAAFEKDPLLRCYFPDEATYPEYATVFFGYLFDKQVHQQTIWMVERGASVAIWQSPGAEGEELDGVLATQLPADALTRFDAFHRAMDAAMPAEPFWYLSVLGTHPESMGRRWGHAVMAVGLRHAAAAGLPAILETSNPDNVEMYRRAGWEVASTFEEPLPTWIMRQSTH
ncbi:GNAT family N-acetyltransferase [Salinispora fenicalii]|uniref:GNAT family N-acetyltransferase n=1 Tax=Salinispora fenicalii TaxID=1137263 RepID=UPI0004890619|nr:N-acetyltransferase [Salinispora fenicalii]